jgi:sec-independent protein translocase protein TatA
MPGGSEWLVIAFIAVLLFGGPKIPALMRGMGQGIREFRKELRGGETGDATGSESGTKDSKDTKSGT